MIKKLKLEKFLKKESYNVDSVCGIDSDDFYNSFLLKDNKLSKITKKEIKKEYLLTSYIPNEFTITYELKIPKNLLDKIDLDDYIETKSYEEVGLDEAEEYIFRYKYLDSVEEDDVLVEVVIVSRRDIETLYEPLLKSYGYVDYISYPGFIFDVLYKDRILDPKKDLFIFLTKNEIFITLYAEGEFLHTSVIPEGLNTIYDELNDNIKIKDFTFDMFIKLLTNKGLELENYSDKEKVLFDGLTEIFSNKFLIVLNQIHSITRKFSLAVIDRVFISTVKGVIPGFSEFTGMYLNLEASDLKFDEKYNPDNIKIDQLLFLSMLYTRYAYIENDQIDNFTLHNRPPTFFYRKSGQLISISFIAILIPAIYLLYANTSLYFIKKDDKVLKTNFNKLRKVHRKLVSMNKNLKDKLLLENNDIANLSTYIKNTEEAINTIYTQKKGYVPKAALISELSIYLHKNNIYLNEVKYLKLDVNSTSNINGIKIAFDKMLMLDIKSDKTSNITNFINEIINEEHFVVRTPGYIQNNGWYRATIIIKVNDE